MLTDYFKCRNLDCKQVWMITILNGRNVDEMCCPSCGEYNFDYAPDEDVINNFND